MDRQDIAYFVNSTPKYYYLLPFHFQLVRRYAPSLKWPLYIGTEEPEHPIIKEVSKKYGVHVISLRKEDSYFLESRFTTTERLPSNIKYVFPIQEDFLLQQRIDEDALTEALAVLDRDSDVLSIRLMPCPGPSSALATGPFCHITNAEKMVFTYQATLFRRETYALFMLTLMEYPMELLATKISIKNANIRDSELSEEQRKERKKMIQIQYNIAEQMPGQTKFWELFGDKKHLAWPRAHSHPNAVYLCPWPYRPTAVERGVLQEWVYEFAEREGYPDIKNAFK